MSCVPRCPPALPPVSGAYLVLTKGRRHFPVPRPPPRLLPGAGVCVGCGWEGAARPQGPQHEEHERTTIEDCTTLSGLTRGRKSGIWGSGEPTCVSRCLPGVGGRAMELAAGPVSQVGSSPVSRGAPLWLGATPLQPGPPRAASGAGADGLAPAWPNFSWLLSLAFPLAGPSACPSAWEPPLKRPERVDVALGSPGGGEQTPWRSCGRLASARGAPCQHQGRGQPGVPWTLRTPAGPGRPWHLRAARLLWGVLVQAPPGRRARAKTLGFRKGEAGQTASSPLPVGWGWGYREAPAKPPRCGPSPEPRGALGPRQQHHLPAALGGPCRTPALSPGPWAGGRGRPGPAGLHQTPLLSLPPPRCGATRECKPGPSLQDKCQQETSRPVWVTFQGLPGPHRDTKRH